MQYWNSAGIGDFRSGNNYFHRGQTRVYNIPWKCLFCGLNQFGFVCFKVRCFWTSEVGRVFLKSAVSFTSALSFLSFLQLLKHGKWNCFYRASKSRRNTDMGGWLFPPTSACYCRLYLTNTVDAMVTVWLTSQKNPKSWNVFDSIDNVGTGFAPSWKVLKFMCKLVLEKCFQNFLQLQM